MENERTIRKDESESEDGIAASKGQEREVWNWWFNQRKTTLASVKRHCRGELWTVWRENP
jgi:hypothetical protein